jgi:hypothetical protein
MSDEVRRDQQNEGWVGRAPGELEQGELQPLLWRAHVYEEVERLAREDKPAPGVYHFAEEYAARAMRGVEASPNEWRHGGGDVAGHLADAGDIAGG